MDVQANLRFVVCIRQEEVFLSSYSIAERIICNPFLFLFKLPTTAMKGGNFKFQFLRSNNWLLIINLMEHFRVTCGSEVVSYQHPLQSESGR